MLSFGAFALNVVLVVVVLDVALIRTRSVPLNEIATGEFILTIEDDKTMKPIMCGVIPAQ